jgi:endonuclease/exonuclease/phosphatase family metal-dependent hydrolase
MVDSRTAILQLPLFDGRFNMRATRWIISTLVLALLALRAMPLTAQTLRIMTFNVRTGIANDGANDWNHRRDIMVRTIRAQHPDVLGAQELNKFQGDYIVGKLPQYLWFGIGRRGDEGDEHMGVFYRTDRLRVIDSGSYWLSDTPDKPGSITWGNLARLSALPANLPIVMTGDFNSAPDRPDHAVLTSLLDDAWINAHSHSGPEKTFHNFTGVPDRRIDWILSRGFHAITASTITTSEGSRYPSDHFPVVAALAWPATPKQH